MEDRVEDLAQQIASAKKVVIFTGAGISTESGLRDFRGPDGIWTRRANGIPAESLDFTDIEPNSGHRAIYELQQLGKLGFLISQNVDNLHFRSGINTDLLAELHGNITKLKCAGCGFLMDNHDDMTECPLCQGLLVSSVVDFGQQLPPEELESAYVHSMNCDLFIATGSSLEVMPAADLPRSAVEAGAKLVIINQSETPLDGLAVLRYYEPIGEVLCSMILHLKLLEGN